MPMETSLLKPKRIEDLPVEELAYRAIKIHLLGALALDYTGTVLDISSQLRDSSTKKPARELRHLCEDYRRTVAEDFAPEVQRRLEEVSLLFEELCGPDLEKLNFGLMADEAVARLAPERRFLAVAVQTAMTVIDTMWLFAADFDAWVARQGVKGRAVFPRQLKSIAALLPEFACGAYNPQSEARRCTARILLDRINELELYGD